MSTVAASLLERARGAMDVLLRELVKFGVVGAVAFVVDLGLFNLLRFGLAPIGLGGSGPLQDKPLSAKVVSVIAATIVAWLGNRLWTFRHRRRASAPRELVLFFAFNAIGLAIALACLGLSHYVLDLRSPLADNISANGIGLVLGTLFRFWAYRRFVFNTELTSSDPVDPTPVATPTAPLAP